MVIGILTTLALIYVGIATTILIIDINVGEFTFALIIPEIIKDITIGEDQYKYTLLGRIVVPIILAISYIPIIILYCTLLLVLSLFIRRTPRKPKPRDVGGKGDIIN